MHIHNIAHRDIKPANLMKISKDKYALADYGIGINLQYIEEYEKKEEDFFQVGNWYAAGTPPFMDPILMKQCKFAMEHQTEIIKKCDRIDLFKADIYSLGLTFF